MLKVTLTALALLLATSSAFAADSERDTAVTQLATLYNSVDACGLILSRAKVDAFRESSQRPDDRLFNVDVFRATQALYAKQKDWTPEQLKTYCTETIAMAKTLGILT